MSDINKRAGEEECGDGRKRGKRGHRGHDGAPGPTGPTGPSNGPTGPTGPGGAPGAESSGLPIIAAALVNGQPVGDGFLSNNGFVSYLRTGPGQYQLALAGVLPPDGNCVVTATLNMFLTTAVNIVTDVLDGVVFVQIYAPVAQGSPVFQDARFNVVVTNTQ